MFDNLRADVRGARKINVPDDWFSQHVKVWLQLGMLAVVNYRFQRFLRRIRIPVVRQLALAFGAIIRFCVQVVTGVDISTEADIGPGLVVHTAHGVFISEVTIGRNCVVQHGVALTYGTSRIGDDVYFGPGAKVIAGANIGNNVVVVANSLVMTDVGDNLTVIGVPARIRLPRGTDAGGKSITGRRAR